MGLQFCVEGLHGGVEGAGGWEVREDCVSGEGLHVAVEIKLVWDPGRIFFLVL